MYPANWEFTLLMPLAHLAKNKRLTRSSVGEYGSVDSDMSLEHAGESAALFRSWSTKVQGACHVRGPIQVLS